jgi:hypothetical protein
MRDVFCHYTEVADVCDDDGVSGANLRGREGGSLPFPYLGRLSGANRTPFESNLLICLIPALLKAYIFM